MGTPTLTLLNSTSISTAESTTGWTTFDLLDADIVKEGTNSITGTFRADGVEGYFDNGSAPVTAAGKTFRMWINTTNVAYIDTLANGGYELSLYDGTTTEYKTFFSSEDYFGGWFNVIFDCDAFTTLTLANVQRWGIRCQHHTSAKNVDNVWVDALKYLDGYSMVGGTSGDPITLADIETADRGTTTLYGYGIITEFGGVYYATGDVQFGSSATTMYFEMDGEILVFEDKPIAAGLYSLSGVGSGSNVTIKNNSTIVSAGTTDATRFVFDWSDTNLASFSCTDSLIVRAAASTFKSGQTVTGCTFNDCGQVTHGGADMSDCTIKGYEGTADTSALVYNVAADPDGELDDASFAMGTASTHAIEFGTSSPLTMTLRGCDFTGYSTTVAQTNSTFYFARTSGTVTLNLVGCSGTIGANAYKTAGATVVIVIDPVTHTFKCVDATAGTAIQSSRVVLWASPTTGSMKANAAITSITRSGSTATVTTTATHGLTTGDIVLIEDTTSTAGEEAYGMTHSITVTGPSAFTYTVVGTPTTPATGTYRFSEVIIDNELTDASGEVSDARTYASNQSVTGFAYKGTWAPTYKTQPISATLSSTADSTTTVPMTSDD